ncbi:MAG: polyprenyl synthetase family protein [Rhodothermales bacterium]
MTVASSPMRARAEVQTLRDRVDAALKDLVSPNDPKTLYDPVRYILHHGGKRLRPILLLLTARAYGASEDDALPAALAVEVFHNFTLVHDDVMDHADERRGRPTVHVKWDESTAILCGDYLMGLSYDLLARSVPRKAAPLVARFQEMVVRLCEGQALDKEFESRSDVTIHEYLDMVDRKTGALLQASLELGGMLGGADGEALTVLSEVGQKTGRAFQIMDDLLDLTARDERWGKAIGGDLVEGKKTYILLRAIELSEGENRAWLFRIIEENGLTPDLLDEARERMERSGVLEEARAEVLRYSADALDDAEMLPDSHAADTLRWLLRRMQERMH